MPLTGGHRLVYFTGYLVSLIGSLSVLSILLFIVIPDCANVAIKSGGAASCEMNMSAVYIVFLIFAALIVYAGVRLLEIVLEWRNG